MAEVSDRLLPASQLRLGLLGPIFPSRCLVQC